MGKLDGKVTVITGGSHGLGLEIAKKFLDEGARVVLASRSNEAVKEAVVILNKGGGQNAAGIAVDVADIEQVKNLLCFTLKTFGKLDIWVNNAGAAGPYGPTVALEPAAFYRVINTNIVGVYNGSRTAMVHFLAQKSGKLINILGAGSEKPVPYQNAYGSSKMWIRAFTLALAEETRASGVGVFAFNPGMVLTDLLTHVEVVGGYENRLKIFPKIVRMLAKPAEIPAQKAVWIASSATDGKTGLAYSLMTPWSFPMGAIREMMRPKKKGDDDTLIKLRIIPPADDIH